MLRIACCVKYAVVMSDDFWRNTQYAPPSLYLSVKSTIRNPRSTISSVCSIFSRLFLLGLEGALVTLESFFVAGEAIEQAAFL